MTNEKTLAELTDEELEAELARRHGARLPNDLRAAEVRSLREANEHGRRSLEALLRARSAAETGEAKRCPRCGKRMPVKAKARERKLRAVTGEVTFRRNYHYCSVCREGFYPLDLELGFPSRGDLTPEAERRVLDFGVNDDFAESAERWSVHYAAPISENLVRRVVDRCADRLEAVPLLRLQEALEQAPSRVADTLIVQMDGSMVPTRGDDAWREVKVGLVVRDDRYAPKAATSRGTISQARYVAHLGSVDEFRRRLDSVLQVEHADSARCVVCVGDGAPWIWNLIQEICPGALELLDWPHAKQAASTCAKTIFGSDDPCASLWLERVAHLLWSDDIATLFQELQACTFLENSAEGRTALKNLRRYLDTNRNRLRYREFRDRGLITGSGFIESAHKHVIQPRMKKAGQHWSPRRGDRMAQLRAAYRTAGPANLWDALRMTA